MMELSRRIFIGNRIRLARDEVGLTQEELGAAYKCSGAHISRIEKGLAGIEIADLESLANILGKPLAWFLSDDVEMPHRPIPVVLRELQTGYDYLQLVHVPILGQAPFGHPSPEEEEIEDYVSVPKAELGKVGKNVYALRAVGECLIGDGISSGDLVIVDPDYELVDSKIYIVRLENEVVVRHIYREGEKLKLVATNEEYEVILPASEVEILGRVILSGSWRRH